MSPPPAQPKIYHITHVDNIPSIIARGGLLSDSGMALRGGPAAPIGMPSIKHRRLTLPLTCHQGDCVGDYVPFNFCPRSVMLFVIFKANDPSLMYRGGQDPIVHLEADLHEVVNWADATGRRWAFSLANAGAQYVEFRASLADLHELDWSAIAAVDFRSPDVKEGKQAEFLVHDFFPWDLVTRIGVHSIGVKSQADTALSAATHHPKVEVRRGWYY